MSMLGRSVAFADPGAIQTTPEWDRKRTGAILSAACVVGATAAIAPKFVVVPLVIPLVLTIALAFPEILLVLFLTAGLYKEDPRVTSVLPIDATVVIAALLLLAVVIRLLRRPFCFPPALWLAAPLVFAVAYGVVSPANAYGAEKALRFCGLTMLAAVAGVLFLDTRRTFTRFLIGLAVLGFLASFDALRTQETTQWGRLTAHGSNPIPLGRMGALAFAFSWLQFHFATRSADRILMAIMLATTALCVLASGSRGPAMSIVASMSLISIVTFVQHRRSPVGIVPLLGMGLLGLVVVTLVSVPELPLYRFQMLFDEDKGSSIFVRGLLYATAWKLMLTHPLGIGIGGFERHAVLDLRYPHNLLLEIGAELGWVPLAATCALIGASLFAMVKMLRREYSWPAVFLSVIVITSLANSMVSGDLNDNRMLFAVLLLPFVFSKIQERERGSAPHTDTTSLQRDRSTG